MPSGFILSPSHNISELIAISQVNNTASTPVMTTEAPRDKVKSLEVLKSQPEKKNQEAPNIKHVVQSHSHHGGINTGQPSLHSQNPSVNHHTSESH